MQVCEDRKPSDPSPISLASEPTSPPTPPQKPRADINGQGGAGSVQWHLAGMLFHHPVMPMLLGDVLDVWGDVTGLDEESVWR